VRSNFAGLVVTVTGGSAGIGRACVDQWAAILAEQAIKRKGTKAHVVGAVEFLASSGLPTSPARPCLSTLASDTPEREGTPHGVFDC
jgi:hypothetical protein